MDKKREQIHKMFPRLKEIEIKINEMGFSNIKKVMENPADSKKINEEFKKNCDALKKERDKIIKDNKIPKSYSVPEYSCKKCNDTGYVGNEKCDCFIKKLVKISYERSNLSIVSKEHVFDNFSLDYYSDKKMIREGMSERKNMEEILSICKKFCNNFENQKDGLLMIGNAGLGKTFLSDCIANEIINKGYSVVYTSATRIFSDYENFRFGKIEKEDFEIEKFYGCDLLIIDDLGTENIIKSGVSFLFDLMNERINRGKKLIINTNFSLDEITKSYSSRFTSRFCEFFIIMHFYGEDIRIKKIR